MKVERDIVSIDYDRVDASKYLREHPCNCPIRVLEHTLIHRTLREGVSHNVAFLTIEVGGVEYHVAEVEGEWPFQAMDLAFRNVLSRAQGAVRIRSVESCAYDLTARRDRSGSPAGMHGKAHVKIAWCVVFDNENHLMDMTKASPVALVRAQRHHECKREHWNTDAFGADSIQATARALVDGYNYYLTSILTRPGVVPVDSPAAVLVPA